MYSVHLLHRYCFCPVLRRFASRRRPPQPSSPRRARHRSRARNGRRPPSSSRHRYNASFARFSSAPPPARTIPPRASPSRRGRCGAAPGPAPVSRAAPPQPAPSPPPGALRSTVCFSFQMDMKSVGSFYYDNFVSIL